MNPRAEIFFEIMKSRRTQRNFSPREVPEELVEKILEAAAWAPSSCNMQLLGLIRVKEPELRRRLVEEAKTTGQAKTAPVLFVATYDKRFSQEYHSNIQSGAAALQNMALATESLGLGAYWAASVGKEKIVRKILKIPKRREILALLMLGFPEKKPEPPRRRKIPEFTHLNYYDATRDLPLSADPDDWPLNQLKTFQEFRVWSGAKYRPYLKEEWEQVINSVKKNLKEKSGVWIDFLPSTGAYLEGWVKNFPDFSFKILEIAEQLARFSLERVEKYGTKPQFFPYDFSGTSQMGDVVSCLFRLEAYPSRVQPQMLRDLASLVRPGGLLILGVCNSSSYFLPLHRLKALFKKEIRFPVMTPQMVAPFKPVNPRKILPELKSLGFKEEKGEYLFLFPTLEELTPFYSHYPPRLSVWASKITAGLEKIFPEKIRRRFAKIHLLFLRKIK